MQLKAKRFDTQRSESVMLPLQRYVCLSDLIEWIGKYDVEIPRDVEQTISAFGLRWEESLTPQERERAMLFPPEPSLANLYRRGIAAALLYRELSERQDKEPAWRNWLISGDAVRLRPEEHSRAWSMLELIALEARQVFWSILNGERPFNPAISVRYPAAMSRPEREWFDAVGFETKEIVALLWPELIVADSGGQLSSPEAREEGAMPPAGQTQPFAHPGRLDKKKLEKQMNIYRFIGRLLSEENQPRYLTSRDIATCFGRCFDKMSAEWSTMLGDPPAWLAPARMSNFPKGTEAIWHPVMIARMLAQGVPLMIQGDSGKKKHVRRINLSILDRIFEARAELADWRPMWGRESETLRSFPPSL